MEIVDPRIDPRLVPLGSRAVVIAEKQEEYQDLPSIRTPNGQVITRWSPSPEERRAIMAGEDIYLTILAVGQVQPVRMTIGPYDWTLCPICAVKPGEDHKTFCPQWKL
jgi:hypothetical protein